MIYHTDHKSKKLHKGLRIIDPPNTAGDTLPLDRTVFSLPFLVSKLISFPLLSFCSLFFPNVSFFLFSVLFFQPFLPLASLGQIKYSGTSVYVLNLLSYFGEDGYSCVCVFIMYMFKKSPSLLILVMTLLGHSIQRIDAVICFTID